MQAPLEPQTGNTIPNGRNTPQQNQTTQDKGIATPANPTAPPQGTDWTSDPIYQLVIGQQNLAIRQAQAAALTAESQALIAYGDPTLALAVTGDQNVATAAGANKASTLARLMAQNKQTVRDTNEAENKANLFYSSDRGYQLGLAQQAYLNNSADALSNVQGTLGSIGSNLLAQQQAAYQNETQAASEAYQRALQNPTGSPAAAGPTPASTTSKTTSSTAPPVAKGTPAPKTATAPYATPITSNPTGGSANKRQGVFAIH